MVVSTTSGSYWGELLATASRLRGRPRHRRRLLRARHGAPGRDALPDVRRRGSLAYDSLGRIDVDDVGVPIECAGVTVHPGDLVIGDDDGVAIVPRGVAEEVIRLAEEKVAGENVVRDRLAEGMPVAEAFRTYGVL